MFSYFREYRDLALNLLREAYSNSDLMSPWLLTYNVFDFGIDNVSNFDIITDIEDNEELIVDNSSQFLLNRIWHGSLYFRDDESSKVELHIIF